MKIAFVLSRDKYLEAERKFLHHILDAKRYADVVVILSQPNNIARELKQYNIALEEIKGTENLITHFQSRRYDTINVLDNTTLATTIEAHIKKSRVIETHFDLRQISSLVTIMERSADIARVNVRACGTIIASELRPPSVDTTKANTIGFFARGESGFDFTVPLKLAQCFKRYKDNYQVAIYATNTSAIEHRLKALQAPSNIHVRLVTDKYNYQHFAVVDCNKHSIAIDVLEYLGCSTKVIVPHSVESSDLNKHALACETYSPSGSIELLRLQCVTPKDPSKYQHTVSLRDFYNNIDGGTLNTASIASNATSAATHPLLSATEKTYVIIPYGIYGGAEVYLYNHLKQVDPSLVCFVFLAPHNLLQSKLKPNFECVNVDSTKLYHFLKSNASRILFYNSKMIYETLSRVKQSKKIHITEIVHSFLQWRDSMHGSNRRVVDAKFVVSHTVAKQWKLASYEVLPPTIDKTIFSPSLRVKQAKTTIGTVARFSPEKNLQKIVDIAEKLDDNYQFIIVGQDGGTKQSLQNYIKSKKLTHRVILKDYTSDIQNEYATFDLFLLTSTIEGTPITILEAQAMEIPVIAPNVGAVKEMLSPPDRLYTSTESSSKIAQLIKQMTHSDVPSAPLPSKLSSHSPTPLKSLDHNQQSCLVSAIYDNQGVVQSFELLHYLPSYVNDYSQIERRKNAFFTAAYTKTVSIVMPVYNRKEALDKALAALTHQTYPHHLIEVIIADDGSSDNPVELVDKYSPYFTISYVQQPDEGYRLSHIRNKAILAAKHEICISLDSDIIWPPSALETIMQWHHVEENIAVLGVQRHVDSRSITAEQILKDINTALRLPDVGHAGTAVSEDYRLVHFKKTNNLKNPYLSPYNFVSGGHMSFPRSIAIEVGLFSEDFTTWGGEDNEFGYRLYNRGLYLVPDQDVVGLHQEHNFTASSDSEKGKDKSFPILKSKVPYYRQTYPNYHSNLPFESWTPKVSVYMTAFNAGEYIASAIDSVLDQDIKEKIELCICDDASTDHTWDIIQSYVTNYPHIVKAVRHDTNQGSAAASNSAIRTTTGEYIAQLDSDDLLVPTALRELASCLDKDPSLGCIYSSYSFLTSAGLQRSPFIIKDYSREMMLRTMIVHPLRMFRKPLFYRIGGFDPSLRKAEDYDFYLKMSHACKMKHYDKELYLYRKHTGNSSSDNLQREAACAQIALQNALLRLGLGWRASVMPGRLATLFLNTKRPSGMSAYMRCKNEKEHLESALRSIAPHVNEIIFIDNNSTDGSLAEAYRLKNLLHLHNMQIYTFSYDIQLDEATLADEINFARDLTNYKWTMKWDADLTAFESSWSKIHSAMQTNAEVVCYKFFNIWGDEKHCLPDRQFTATEPYLQIYRPDYRYKMSKKLKGYLFNEYLDNSGYKRTTIPEPIGIHLHGIKSDEALLLRKYMTSWWEHREHHKTMFEVIRQDMKKAGVFNFSDLVQMYLAEVIPTLQEVKLPAAIETPYRIVKNPPHRLKKKEQ